MTTILPRCAPAPQSWAEIPKEIRLRLAGYQINGASDWRKLRASERSKLFGITRAHRALLDSAARGGL